MSGLEQAPLDWRCYRHPEHEAGVRCHRCERPICPQCMVAAPVGFQCPECVRAAPPVRSFRTLRMQPTWWSVTGVLVAVNLGVFLAGSGSRRLEIDGGLLGRAVADGEWWRVVTAGFLHANLLHVAFNCLLLWQLGSMLEPALGRARFAALYGTALVAGSFGALVVEPDALTIGASGAVFGLMGAAVVTGRGRAFVPLLVLNLAFTFAVPGISIGGHVGGLAGGALAARLTEPLAARDGTVLATVLGVAVFAASLWLASNPL